jgi:signal transduction histidine kinase
MNVLRSLWAEPRAPGAPARVWRDWALVAVVVLAAVLETLLLSDLVWRPLSLAVCLALAPTLLWRRREPLLAVALAFGTIAVVDVVAFVRGVEWTGLSTTAYILILLYALFRWGAGREVALGLPVVAATVVLGLLVDADTVGDLVGGTLVLLFVCALGAAVRYERDSRRRELEHAKDREREELARELHDTVAHHVSAIAVQAQAGRALAPTRPDASVEALAVIEEEASRTLTEMRAIVGALRGGEAELAPQRGVADIEGLARAADGAPQVRVALSGDLEDLMPSVDAALYRLAQESITNAVRHARRASRVDVRVTGDSERVRLTVVDDGEAGRAAGGAPGYGITGMRERAVLLGGSLDAGPNSGGGWTVDAVLPRRGAVR